MGWARASNTELANLRRGAWYPIIEDLANRVVLAVGDRNVVVHRELIQVSTEPPRTFSVVERTETDRNPKRGTPADLGSTYAVCPWAQCRVPVRLKEHMECPECYHWAAIDWSSPC